MVCSYPFSLAAIARPAPTVASSVLATRPGGRSKPPYQWGIGHGAMTTTQLAARCFGAGHTHSLVHAKVIRPSHRPLFPLRRLAGGDPVSYDHTNQPLCFVVRYCFSPECTVFVPFL